jgi:hypothetical protein
MKNRLDFIPHEENTMAKFLKKYLWKAIVSGLAVVFLIFHEEIYNRLPLGKKSD